MAFLIDSMNLGLGDICDELPPSEVLLADTSIGVVGAESNGGKRDVKQAIKRRQTLTEQYVMKFREVRRYVDPAEEEDELLHELVVPGGTNDTSGNDHLPLSPFFEPPASDEFPRVPSCARAGSRMVDYDESESDSESSGVTDSESLASLHGSQLLSQIQSTGGAFLPYEEATSLDTSHAAVDEEQTSSVTSEGNLSESLVDMNSVARLPELALMKRFVFQALKHMSIVMLHRLQSDVEDAFMERFGIDLNDDDDHRQVWSTPAYDQVTAIMEDTEDEDASQRPDLEGLDLVHQETVDYLKSMIILYTVMRREDEADRA